MPAADLIDALEKVVRIESLLWAGLIVIALLSLARLWKSSDRPWFRIETVEEEEDE